MKRTPIRRVSARMRVRLAKYRPLRDTYLADHPRCEFPGCVSATTELHHRAGREGDRLYDQRFFAASCHYHNDLAETDTGKCRAVGWLLSYINPEGP